jgi:hypothetical protein
MSPQSPKHDAPVPPLRATFQLTGRVEARFGDALLVRIAGTTALAIVADPPGPIGDVGSWLEVRGPGAPVSLVPEIALVLCDAEIRVIAPPELPQPYLFLL